MHASDSEQATQAQGSSSRYSLVFTLFTLYVQPPYLVRLVGFYCLNFLSLCPQKVDDTQSSHQEQVGDQVPHPRPGPGVSEGAVNDVAKQVIEGLDLLAQVGEPGLPLGGRGPVVLILQPGSWWPVDVAPDGVEVVGLGDGVQRLEVQVKVVLEGQHLLRPLLGHVLADTAAEGVQGVQVGPPIVC